MSGRFPHARRIARALVLLVAGFLCGLVVGCSSGPMKIDLPEISASKISYHRTDPAGGTKITAEGVSDEDTVVKAKKVTLDTTYPSFSVSIVVEDYERKKSQPAAAGAKP